MSSDPTEGTQEQGTGEGAELPVGVADDATARENIETERKDREHLSEGADAAPAEGKPDPDGGDAAGTATETGPDAGGSSQADGDGSDSGRDADSDSGSGGEEQDEDRSAGASSVRRADGDWDAADVQDGRLPAGSHTPDLPTAASDEGREAAAGGARSGSSQDATAEATKADAARPATSRAAPEPGSQDDEDGTSGSSGKHRAEDFDDDAAGEPPD